MVNQRSMGCNTVFRSKGLTAREHFKVPLPLGEGFRVRDTLSSPAVHENPHCITLYIVALVPGLPKTLDHLKVPSEY
jgi:hypothetical protein